METKYYIIYALKILYKYVLYVDTDGVTYQDGNEIKFIKWEDIWRR